MSPLWRIYLYPLLRSSAVWLALQPLIVMAAVGLPAAGMFLEAVLVLLGILLAFGVQSALPRERVEYLRQLPFSRREVARSMHVAAMIVLGGTCLLEHLAVVSGFAKYSVWYLNILLEGVREQAPTLEPHFEGLAWCNLYGLPFLSYWSVAGVLQLRRVQSREMLARVSWLVLLGPIVVVGGMWTVLLERPGPPFDIASHNVPGVLAALAAWWLARRVLRRADREGIDAYPQEDLSWES